MTTLFDSASQVTGTLDARANLTQFLFDSVGRKSVTVDPLGNRVTR